MEIQSAEIKASDSVEQPAEVPLSPLHRKLANRIQRRAVKKMIERLQDGPAEGWQRISDQESESGDKPAKLRAAMKKRSKKYAALKRKRRK